LQCIILIIVIFEKLAYISQGSVATQLRCGEIFNNHFTVNCPQSDDDDDDDDDDERMNFNVA